jgi:DNA-binding LacI/PurR family transcriptional regulator
LTAAERFGKDHLVPLRLQRLSLIDQLGAVLRTGIEAGQWPENLPSERRLCAELRVGRNSLRTALRLLAQEKLVKIIPGEGTRNLRSPRVSQGKAVAAFSVLSPFPLEQLRPQQVLWIDELRDILSAEGRALRVVHGPQYFRRNPAGALRRLVAQERCDCWILVKSTQAMQAWFKRAGGVCVIAGSCHPGMDLPFVDLDYRAMCRHAVGVLVRTGHRDIAYLMGEPEAAGDLQSERGFLEGVQSFRSQGAQGVVVRHAGHKKSIVESVRFLLGAPRSTTALIINQSYHYLTVTSALARLGLQTPEDISLICRDDDRFLAYLEPPPARFVEDPRDFARKLARITITQLQDRPRSSAQCMILPAFIRGASIAPPRTAADRDRPSR